MDPPMQAKQIAIQDEFSTIELSKKPSFSKIHPKPKPILINNGGIDTRKKTSLHPNHPKRRSLNFGKYTSEEAKRLSNEKKKIDTIYAVLSCVGLAFAWIENDIFYNNGNKLKKIKL